MHAMYAFFTMMNVTPDGTKLSIAFAMSGDHQCDQQTHARKPGKGTRTMQVKCNP